jgi:hypothetical protein
VRDVSGADCTVTPAVACRLGTLAPGEQRAATLRLVLRAAGDVRQKVLVASDTPELAPADNATELAFAVLQPVLHAQPMVAPPGSLTVVTGDDFPPDETVRLRWDRGDALATAGTELIARTDGNGHLAVHLPVLDDGVLGPRQILAGGPYTVAPLALLVQRLTPAPLVPATAARGPVTR